MILKYTLAVVCLILKINSIAQNGSVSILPIYDTTNISIEPNTDSFCVILNQIISDATGSFVHAKGKEIEVHSETSIWSSNTGLPGAVTSSLIFTTSWHYEGVIYMSNSADVVGAYYGKYKNLLEECLPAKGYHLSGEKNTEPKLEKYPNLVYTKSGKDKIPRITMEVDYSDNTGTNTLTINVWQGEK